MENDETIPMERTAMKKTRFPLLILGATALLAACAENPYRGENAKTATGATIGAVAGGVLGRVVASDNAKTGGTLIGAAVGATVGGLIGGYLGDRIAHKRIIVVSLALAIFPTVYFYLHPGTEPLSLVALFLTGALLLAPQPSSLVWAQRAMPGSEGMASGMMLGFSFGLGSLGTAVTAALGDQIGLTPALLISSLTLPIAAICTIFAPFPLKIE